MKGIDIHLKLWHIFAVIVILSSFIVKSKLRKKIFLDKSAQEIHSISEETRVLNLVYTDTKTVSKENRKGTVIEVYRTPDTVGNCIRFYTDELKSAGWILRENGFIPAEKRQKMSFLKGTEEIEILLDSKNQPGTEISVSRRPGR